jgi:hypothetical protein
VKIVLCEAGPLSAGRDAGTQADIDFFNGVQALGHHIQILTESQCRIADAVTEFQPDIVAISRPGLFLRLFDQLKNFDGPIIYLAHDVHHERLRLQSEFGAADATAWRVMQFAERFCFERATLSLLPTDEDASLVRERFPLSNVLTIPYFNMQPELDSATQAGQKVVGDDFSLVFIGGASHHPNSDGMEWFSDAIAPRIAEAIASTHVNLIGNWNSKTSPQRGNTRVSLLGILPSREVSKVFMGSDAGIAPLRFGSGMKRKVLHYMTHGLPVLSTSYGVQGLVGLAADSPPGQVENEVIPGVLLCTSVDEWVSSCELLDSAHHLGEEIGERGRAFVTEHFSSGPYQDGLRRVLSAVS